MRIEDIARLAGVSISTVSKIVNGKDQGIHPKTRERVLAIVKEYNYTPYSSVRNNTARKTFLLGLLIGRNPAMHEVLRGVTDCAQNNNYGVIVCNSGGDPARELKNITMLCRNHIDGIIWDRSDEPADACERELRKNGVLISLAGYGGELQQGHWIDYPLLGYTATKVLAEREHRRIGCVIHASRPECLAFAQGFRRCMFERQLLFDEATNILDTAALGSGALQRGLTGFVCFDDEITRALAGDARRRGIKIPEQLSIIGMTDREEEPFDNLSMIPLPLREYGKYLCAELIGRIEKTADVPPPPFDWSAAPAHLHSVDIPHDSRSKSILVVGSINLDVLINIGELPQTGKTVVAHSINNIPGGKGLNQAVGAAKLTSGVSLIARMGKDYESTRIYTILNDNHIETQGITQDNQAGIGKAYIYVQPGGDSSIVIYPGANENLSVSDILKNEELFQSAGLCLLPMELPGKTVEFAADMARRYGVMTVLKPSALHVISDTLLRKIDIFVPNEMESIALCPHAESTEQRALYFLEKGVGTVIITLGSRGCYLKNRQNECYFPAADFKVLDTTGGADAFISALAVYLNEGTELTNAIRRAICAAGFCVSRQGTLPALVDRTTLDLYLDSHLV